MKISFGLNGTFQGRGTVLHGVLQKRSEGSSCDLLNAYLENNKVNVTGFREVFFQASQVIRTFHQMGESAFSTVNYGVGYDEFRWGVSFSGKMNEGVDPVPFLKRPEVNPWLRRICFVCDEIDFLYEATTRQFEIRMYRNFASQKTNEIEIRVITHPDDSIKSGSPHIEYIEIGDLDYNKLLDVKFDSAEDESANQLYKIPGQSEVADATEMPKKSGFLSKIGGFLTGKSSAEKPVKKDGYLDLAEESSKFQSTLKEFSAELEGSQQDKALEISKTFKTISKEWNRKKLQLESDVRVKDDLLKQKVQLVDQLKTQSRHLSENLTLSKAKVVDYQKMDAEFRRTKDERDRLLGTVAQMKNQVTKISQMVAAKKMNLPVDGSAKDSSAELIHAKEKITILDAKVKELEQENKKHVDTIRDIRRIQERLTSVKASGEVDGGESEEVTELREQLKATTDMIVEYRKESEYLKLRVEELVREETRLKLENEALRSRLKKTAA